jgi:hypothetical protein
MLLFNLFNYKNYTLENCDFPTLKQSVANGQFSFATSVIFLLNRLLFRNLFLEAFAWCSPLKDYPVVSNLLGIMFLLIISFMIAALIVSNSFVSFDMTVCHMYVLSWSHPPVPPLYERCVISFMKYTSTIGFYACKYRVIKYSLYFVGFILIIVYCFTGSIIAILAVWFMTSLQKYCKYVVFKMFDPKKLHLDLTFTTFRAQTSKYWTGKN